MSNTNQGPGWAFSEEQLKEFFAPLSVAGDDDSNVTGTRGNSEKRAFVDVERWYDDGPQKDGSIITTYETDKGKGHAVRETPEQRNAHVARIKDEPRLRNQRHAEAGQAIFAEDMQKSRDAAVRVGAKMKPMPKEFALASKEVWSDHEYPSDGTGSPGHDGAFRTHYYDDSPNPKPEDIAKADALNADLAAKYPKPKGINHGAQSR